MLDLLKRMAPGDWNSRKTGATLRCIRSTPPKVYVEEYFDDGRGHSGAFTSDCTDVAPELFERALREGYITNKPEWGRVSGWEFIISESGERAHEKNVWMTRIVREHLFPGKGMRASDLRPYLEELSEEAIVEILEDLVRRKHAESYSYSPESPKFYLFKRRIAA